MAKELYDKEIDSSIDWGGDATTGGKPVKGSRVQEFIKNKKVGYIRTTENVIQYFKDELSSHNYDEAPDKDKSKFIMGQATVFIDRSSYKVELINNLSSTEFFAAVGKECFIDFSMLSQKDPNGTNNYQDTNERGVVTIYKRLGGELGDLVEIVSPFIIYSGLDRNCRIDISEHLSPGDNLIEVAVEGESTKLTNVLRYKVNLTTLNLNADKFAYYKPWIEGLDYNINDLNIKGNLKKILYIKFAEWSEDKYLVEELYLAGSQFDSKSILIPYDKFPMEFDSGVHELLMWMTSQDNSIKTDVLTFNIICVKKLDEENGVYLNLSNIADKVINNDKVTLFNYVIYASGTTKNLRFSLKTINETEGSVDLSLPPQIVPTNTLNSLDLTLQVNSNLSDFKLEYIVIDDDNDNQLATGLILVDNTKGFGATGGYEFYMNPQNRSNFEEHRNTIRNEVGGQLVTSHFSGFNWTTDGWIRENDVASLKLFSNSKVEIDYNPFENYNRSKGLTLEMLFKTSFITDYNEPFLTILQTEKGRYNGIKMTPSHITLHSTNLVLNDRDQSCYYKEDEIIHLVISIVPRAHAYDNFYVVRIYLNGHINREFTFSANDTWKLVGGAEGAPKIIIGSSTCDLNIYGLRFYNKFLSLQEVFKNYLNWVDNSLMLKSEFDRNNLWGTEGALIDYNLTKKLYNTFTVEMLIGGLPSIMVEEKPDTRSNLEVFYKDHPDWNFKLLNTPMDGLGTTAMTYYRWNLRWSPAGETHWVYASGEDIQGNIGTIDNNSHRLCKRITAKKNYASSMQSHKLGSVNSYTDILREYHSTLEGDRRRYHNINEIDILDESPVYKITPEVERRAARVTIYQYPFVGFLKIKKPDAPEDATDDKYYDFNFIGLYTLGPDKSDDITFGFSDTDKSLFLAIEGADNTPWLTMFLIPWKLDDRVKMIALTTYKCLCRIIKGTNEKSWHYSSGGASYKGETLEDIETLVGAGLEEYWRPAYNFVFECNANIKPYNGSIEQLNKETESNAKYLNSPINYWCTDNCLYYYEVNTNRWESANSEDTPKDPKPMNLRILLNEFILEVLAADVNSKISLVLPITFSSPEEAWAYLDSPEHSYNSPEAKNEIYRKCRIKKFKEKFGDYFDLEDTIFYRNFIEFNAASDNKAKNTYPYNFCDRDLYGKLSKWRWRADDLDTIFDVNNQGQSTKEYYVEFNDVYEDSGTKVWAGSESVLWNMLDLAFPEEILKYMKKYIEAVIRLGTGSSMNISSIVNFYDKYYFDQTSKYFALNLYNIDAEWSYEKAWIDRDLENYTQSDTNPISQSLGNHYLPEVRWVINRSIYMMSKYALGSFDPNSHDDNITYRAYKGDESNQVNYSITPAITMYPRMQIGTSVLLGKRTKAGEVCKFSGDAGDGQHIIMGANYLKDIGNIYEIPMEGEFVCHADRLLKLLLGNDSSIVKNRKKGLTAVHLFCPSLLELNLKNLKYLEGTVDLSSCIHLRRLEAFGSSVKSFIFCDGVPLEYVEIPSETNYLRFKDIFTLHNENLHFELVESTPEYPAYNAIDNINKLFILNCVNIKALDLVLKMHKLDSAKLEGIRLTNIDESYDDPKISKDICTLLYYFGKKTEITKHPNGIERKFHYKGLNAEGDMIEDSKPIIEGHIYLKLVYNAYEAELPSLLDKCVFYKKGTPKPKGYQLYIEYGEIIPLEPSAFELKIIPSYEESLNIFYENNVPTIKFESKAYANGIEEPSWSDCLWSIESLTKYQNVLPLEYVLMQGLYIDTGIPLQGKPIQIILKASYLGTNEQYLFGVSKAIEEGITTGLFGFSVNNHFPLFHVETVTTKPGSTLQGMEAEGFKGPFTITADVSNCIIENGSEYKLNISSGRSTIETIGNKEETIYIGANHYADLVYFNANMRFYSCQISVDGITIRNFIPVVDYNGSVKIYEEKSKALYNLNNITDSYTCIKGPLKQEEIFIKDSIKSSINNDGLVTIEDPYININTNTDTTFTVTAKSKWNSNKTTSSFIVKGVALSGIKFKADKLFANMGDKIKIIDKTYTPSNTTKVKYITYESSDPKIMTTIAATGNSLIISSNTKKLDIRARTFSILSSIKIFANDIVIINKRDSINSDYLARRIYEVGQKFGITHYPDKIYSMEASEFERFFRIDEPFPEYSPITRDTIVSFNEFKYFTSMIDILRAFANSEMLKRVTLPKHLTSLGWEMFYNCPHLENITFIEDGLDNLQLLDSKCLADCPNLSSTTLTLGKNFREIKSDALKNSSITVLDLRNSNNIVSIDVSESNVKNINLPISVAKLSTLKYSPVTTDVVILNIQQVLKPDYSLAINNITNLTLKNNNGIANFGILADFLAKLNPLKLTTLKIELTKVEDMNFNTIELYRKILDKELYNLDTLIGNIRVPLIYNDLLEGLNNKFPKLKISYTNPDPILINFKDNEVKRICAQLLKGDSDITAKKLGTIGIINNEFKDNQLIQYFNEFKYLVNAKLALTNVGIFENCSNLTEITMPEWEALPENICRNSGVQIVHLPQTVKKVNGFSKCVNLSLINLENVQQISDFTGSKLNIDINCPNLTFIKNGCFESTEITSVSNLGKIENLYERTFFRCKEARFVNLPDSLEALLGGNIFGEWKKGEYVSFKNPINFTLNSLEGVFGGSSFKTIDIPNCVNTLIGTFENCQELEKINYSGTLVKVGDSAFRSCYNLKHLPVSEAITYIDDMAFYLCGDIDNYEFSFPNLSYLGPRALACGVKKISNLGTIITSIDYETFDYFDIRYIKIPKLVTSLGSNAVGNSLLRILILENDLVPVSASALDRLCPETSIYVPDNLVSTYRNAAVWSRFSPLIKGISSLDTSLKIDSLESETNYEFDFHVNLAYTGSSDNFEWELIAGLEYVSLDRNGHCVVKDLNEKDPAFHLITVKCTNRLLPSLTVTENILVKYGPSLLVNRHVEPDSRITFNKNEVLVDKYFRVPHYLIEMNEKYSYISTYDENKNYIERVGGPWGFKPNVKYIRFSIEKTRLNNFYIKDKTTGNWLFKGKNVQ